MKTLYRLIKMHLYLSPLFLCLFSFGGVAAAQNKVVVIPLGGDTVFEVKSGQTLAGRLSERFTPSSFFIVGDSYPVPLPAGTPIPILEYTTTSSSANCPGEGSANSGYLCVYAFNNSNVGNAVGFSGSSISAGRYRYCFSIDFLSTNTANAGFLLASWAYKVP